MKSLIYLFFLSTLLFSNCSVLNSITSDEYYSEESAFIVELNNTCYEVSIIDAELIKTEETFAIYKGDIEKENVILNEIELLIEPPSVEWVKQKTKGDCYSSNLDDCYVWGLKRTIPLTEKITVLVDTSLSKNFYLETFEIYKSDKKANIRNEKVICEEDLSQEVIIELQKKLLHENYLEKIDYQASSLSKSTLQALYNFQKDNDLPYGTLSLQSLELLNFKFLE